MILGNHYSPNNECANYNIKLIEVLTIIQFAILLEEFRFFLGRTISGADHLDRR